MRSHILTFDLFESEYLKNYKSINEDVIVDSMKSVVKKNLLDKIDAKAKENFKKYTGLDLDAEINTGVKDLSDLIRKSYTKLDSPDFKDGKENLIKEKNDLLNGLYDLIKKRTAEIKEKMPFYVKGAIAFSKEKYKEEFEKKNKLPEIVDEFIMLLNGLKILKDPALNWEQIIKNGKPIKSYEIEFCAGKEKYKRFVGDDTMGIYKGDRMKAVAKFIGCEKKAVEEKIKKIIIDNFFG